MGPIAFFDTIHGPIVLFSLFLTFFFIYLHFQQKIFNFN